MGAFSAVIIVIVIFLVIILANAIRILREYYHQKDHNYYDYSTVTWFGYAY